MVMRAVLTTKINGSAMILLNLVSIKKKSINRTALNRWYIYLLIVLVMPIFIFIAERNIVGIEPFISDGPSMSPTLNYNSRFMVSTNTNNLKHGDIIIFNAPEGKMYVKRIIGLGGDTIEIKNNTVYLNGDQLDEPYISDTDFELYKIPKDMFFVLGDNRPNSHDSRAMGPITKDKIVGKALFVFYEKGKIIYDKKL
jgi:signal peptidase I